MTGSRQLGDFLRSRRHRLDPDALGLSAGRRRRTPGLRREEVAERAGISCEWYVKLEQGRRVSASAQTVAALATALALDASETKHLERLASGASTPAFVRETVPDIVAQIVGGLPGPAYVTGMRWDVLAWNDAADAIFGFTRMGQGERNILLWMFIDPAARTLFGDTWQREGRRMVALFRATHDQRAGDPAFRSLVTALEGASPAFRAWWSAHDVDQPSAGRKSLRLADGSVASFAYASFQSNEDPALRLSLYRLED